MELKTLFRNLVTNHYMPDFDYNNYEFSFRTVFYTTPDYYCCCPCAFEHEFLQYISDTGEIKEDSYTNVLQNVLNGKCTHVNGVPESYVTNTSIYGIHIAAAVGTEAALEIHLSQSFHQEGGIFELNAGVIGVLKSNHERLKKLTRFRVWEMFDKNGIPVVHYLDENVINVSYCSLFQFCIKTENEATLKSHFLKYQPSAYKLNKVFEYTIKNKLTGSQELLLEYASLIITDSSCNPVTNICQFMGVTAIVYNEAELLSRILTIVSKCKLDSELERRLVEACCIFNRTKCLDILLMHRPQIPLNKYSEISTADKMRKLFNTLDHLRYDLKDDVTTIFRPFPNKTFLLEYFYKALSTPGGSKLAHALVHYIDVDSVDHYGYTPLRKLLKGGSRYMIETIISKNPAPHLHTSVVKKALKLDRSLEERRQCCAPLGKRYSHSCSCKQLKVGTYKMDCDLNFHSDYGHIPYNFALNFYGPLLIECGFPYENNTLLEALQTHLHEAELAYLRTCLDIPRPLKLACRDILRKHFQGQKIHSFVNLAGIPDKLKDFVLLKDILLYVQDEVYFR